VSRRPHNSAVSLERQVATRVEELGLRDRALLVAVSGGSDSVCLLAILARLAEPLGLRLAVGHVDHGLRGEESREDARFVEEQADALQLPFGLRAVDPYGLREGTSSRARPTVQEAARQLRYEALYALADAVGATRILTAHHADDQAETVLLRLLRGSGPEGLGGIPEVSPDGRVVRPLLEVPRAELERYRDERGLAFREDSSNARDDYARNRLRHHWLPQLARDFNPSLLRAVGGLAEAQRRDAEWIDTLVEQALDSRVEPSGVEGSEWVIRQAGWESLPDALARRAVKRLLERAGGGRDITRRHLLRVLAFLRQGREARVGAVLELPGGLRLRADRSTFWLARLSPADRAGLPVGKQDGC